MDLDVAKRALETGITFVANCGLRVLELRRGYVKCLVPFEGNSNQVGTMYAGALFTVAEIPGGALFLSSFDTRRYFPIVTALDMRFLKPAKSDVTIEMTLDDDRQEDEQHEQPQGEGRTQSLGPACVTFIHDRHQVRDPFPERGAILTQEGQAVTGDRTQEGLRIMAFATWDAAVPDPSTA